MTQKKKKRRNSSEESEDVVFPERGRIEGSRKERRERTVECMHTHVHDRACTSRAAYVQRRTLELVHAPYTHVHTRTYTCKHVCVYARRIVGFRELDRPSRY